MHQGIGKYSIVLNFGVTVVSNIAVGAFLGYYIDRWTVKNGVLFVIFILLGVASGLYNGFKYLLKEADKYDRHDKKDGEKHSDSRHS
ncbi:AtpZ/AtpI family protein [Thermotoga profunda]|uniref:AtpZ/AtpI family protein n=1 Tax=Thermotoga profunda TaxID=1508420 RepID=UPI000597BCE9|nr:AtpZ/AtpI family protein [Thermotoga profunda]